MSEWVDQLRQEREERARTGATTPPSPPPPGPYPSSTKPVLNDTGMSVEEFDASKAAETQEKNGEAPQSAKEPAAENLDLDSAPVKQQEIAAALSGEKDATCELQPPTGECQIQFQRSP